MYERTEVVQRLYLAHNSTADAKTSDLGLQLLEKPDQLFAIKPEENALRTLDSLVTYLATFPVFADRDPVGLLLGSHVRSHVLRRPGDLDWALMLKESDEQRLFREKKPGVDFFVYLAASLKERDRLTFGNMASSFLGNRGLISCNFQSLYGLYPITKLESESHADHFVKLALETAVKMPEKMGKLGFYVSLYFAPSTLELNGQSLQTDLLINSLKKMMSQEKKYEQAGRELINAIVNSLFFYYRIREKHIIPDWDLHVKKRYYQDDYDGELPWTDLSKQDMEAISSWLEEANAAVRCQVDVWVNSLMSS
jgi:hypothetical protein